MLKVQNVMKFYPERDATQKGHMNQIKNNVWSTKSKTMKEADTTKLQWKQKRYVYVKVHDIKDIIQMDQTSLLDLL